MLRAVLQEFTLKGSWLSCLLGRELGSLAKLSINTDYEDWFEALYTLEEDQVELFDNFCNHMAAIVLEQLLLTGVGSTRSPSIPLKDWSKRNILKSGVYLKSWEYLVSNKFPFQYTMAFYHPNMPEAFKGSSIRIGCISIYITMVELIQEELHKFLIRPLSEVNHIKYNDTPAYDTFEEVNRFVGYAIGRVIEITKMDGEKQTLLRFMGSKSCYYGKEYHEKYVSTRDRIVNKGGYCFVSPRFFNFGYTIMKHMSAFQFEEMLAYQGPHCIINFRKKIFGSRAIKNAYYEAVYECEGDFSKETLLNVLQSILEKCCNSYNKAQTSLYKTNIMLQNCADLNKLNFRDQLKAKKREEDKK